MSGQIYNPLTHQMANGTPGYHLYILEYPFGSFTPDQPAAPVTVNCFMAANATIALPLNVSAVPVFRFGDDPIDNPFTDPAIYGPRANSTVTPTVIRLTKTTTVSENEISTGPNYPVTYILTLDIATGAVVNNVTISDLLSGNMQFLNMINSSGGNFTAPNSTTRGGIINVTFGTLVGIAGTDKTVTYRAYAPEFNSTSQPVINPLTGLPSSGPNDSWATGKYGNLTVTDNGTNTNYNITLRSLSIQKSVLDLNGPNVKPTDTLQYSIAFQVSDYFQFKDIIITDIIGDGQSFLSSFIPYLIINTNGTTNNITFNSSNYIVTHNNATGHGP
ncbi:MAG: hypothetical protein Q8N97_10310 [Methanobacteriaceae archaeon]|nr:hypothetical protein [Methanobacteriaceae archaeon]MDP3035729.1 hypothetical protein [Methanobacteriaceae archaeon]